jgi:dienelactone hydrolase
VKLKGAIITVLFLSFACNAKSQVKIDFRADDGLLVTADKYFVHDTLPWILMFHQSGSSRGEFTEIAPKLVRLGYNGLAVDLRYGREINFIANETSLLAQAENFPRTMTDARRDIQAAMDWVSGQSEKPVILLGSSFSASLALILAKDNPATSAVIAFSPGEFFGPPDLVRNAIRNLDVPVFLAATRREYPYVTELCSGISTDKKTIFRPAENPGVHGAKTLWESEVSSPEYWLNLLMFINRIRIR